MGFAFVAAIDFLINLHACSTVCKKKREGALEKAGEELMVNGWVHLQFGKLTYWKHKSLTILQLLTLNEFLELIVPVTYLLCFLVAFYGPNSHVIGVGCHNTSPQKAGKSNRNSQIENLFLKILKYNIKSWKQCQNLGRRGDFARE